MLPDIYIGIRAVGNTPRMHALYICYSIGTLLHLAKTGGPLVFFFTAKIRPLVNIEQ